MTAMANHEAQFILGDWNVYGEEEEEEANHHDESSTSDAATSVLLSPIQSHSSNDTGSICVTVNGSRRGATTTTTTPGTSTLLFTEPDEIQDLFASHGDDNGVELFFGGDNLNDTYHHDNASKHDARQVQGKNTDTVASLLFPHPEMLPEHERFGSDRVNSSRPSQNRGGARRGDYHHDHDVPQDLIRHYQHQQRNSTPIEVVVPNQIHSMPSLSSTATTSIPFNTAATATTASRPISPHSKPQRGSPVPPPSPSAVSPKSVLENIQRRARRRQEILENSPIALRHVNVPISLSASLSTMEETITTMTTNTTAHTNASSQPTNTTSRSQTSALTPPATNVTKASAGNTSLPVQQRLGPPTQPPSPKSPSLQYWYDKWQSASSPKQRRKRLSRGQPEHSVAVARAAMYAGHAAATERDYVLATQAFAEAAHIYKIKLRKHWISHEDTPPVNHRYSLPYAAALHHQGTSMNRCHRDCSSPDHEYGIDKTVKFRACMECLQTALDIRLAALGSDHVDTVATLNSMAWVHMHAQKNKRASELFWQVFWRRAAIFGTSHPAVAVAAHDLANSFCRLHRADDAQNFYSIALQIYDTQHVPQANPAVARLLADMRRLERMTTMTGSNKSTKKGNKTSFVSLRTPMNITADGPSYSDVTGDEDGRRSMPEISL